MSKSLRPFLTAGVILLVAVVGWWIGSSDGDQPVLDAGAPTAPSDTIDRSPEPDSSPQPSEPEPSEAVAEPAGDAQAFSDLPTITTAELPPEALDTLDDIAAGGPYDFSKDDSVFQNREGFLPDRARGHYREYTVITPGSPDRGARRIVAGADGELYYTDDHYASFREIVG